MECIKGVHSDVWCSLAGGQNINQTPSLYIIYNYSRITYFPSANETICTAIGSFHFKDFSSTSVMVYKKLGITFPPGVLILNIIIEINDGTIMFDISFVCFCVQDV